MFQVFALVIALALFIFFAYNRVGSAVLAAGVAVITCLLCGLPVVDTMLGPFMASAAGFFTNYFPIFFLGALVSAVYAETGAAKSIANTLTKVSGGKHLPAVIFICTAILTYGGISGFVVYFVMYPICLEMWRKSNLSRILIPAAITAGTWTISMTLPGSPSVQNVIAIKSLGTPATAALIPGIVGGLFEAVAIILWFEYREKRLRKLGRVFDDPDLPPLPPEEQTPSVLKDEDLPNTILSFVPIVIILVLFNGFKLKVELAVFVGLICACVMFFKQLKGGFSGYVNCLNRGMGNSFAAIMNSAIIVGFGGVAKQTEGFWTVVNGLSSWNINPLVFVAISVAVCAGLCASASGGMGIAYDALTPTFLKLGVNLQYVHRISAIAAGTLDSLPHQGGQMTIYAVTHMNHKWGYYDIAITQLVIPLLSLFIVIPLCALGL